MTSSDGKSAAPLRKRKSKRFDRSGSNQRRVPAADAADRPTAEPTGDIGAQTEASAAVENSSLHADGQVSPSGPASSSRKFVPLGPASESQAAPTPQPNVVTDGAVRGTSLDDRQACGRCGHELSMVNIEVDGNVLIMESCDNCDARRWQLAGEPLDLQQVLDHVGEHAGRRR